MKIIIFLITVFPWAYIMAQYTAIPNNGFEQQLINQGIDTEGMLDGQVLTSDIENIIELTLVSPATSLQGIEGFVSLEVLWLLYSDTWYMDLSQNLALRELRLHGLDYIETLDLTANINLERFDLYDGILTELNLSGLTNLTYVECSSSNLNEINVTDCTQLETMICPDNPLQNGIDINTNINLKTLVLSGPNCQLSSLNTSLNVNLETLVCPSCQITQLNLENNPNLKFINCAYIPITNLEVNNNPLLEVLICPNTELSNLNLANNNNLERLTCSNTLLVDLNLSNNPQLELLDCSDNNLETLYIQNGANELLSGTYESNGTTYPRFNALNNPNLTCIFVDDASYCEENWTNVDSTSHFVTTQTECDALGIEETFLQNQVFVYPNPVQDILKIEKNHPQAVKEITLTNILGQKHVITDHAAIDMSSFPQGLYVLTLMFEGEQFVTYKILKQ
jgi:uncharacterized protein YbaR (Trm112 family)